MSSGMLLLAGCSFRNEKGGALEPLNGTAWFSWLQRNIIDPRCISCHNGGSAGGGHDFTSYALMVGGGTIARFKPDQSLFLSALVSGKMPKGANRLSDQEIEIVRDWIARGAPELKAETPPPPSDPKPTYTWLNENVFVPRCLACHKAPKPKGGVDFSSYLKLMDSEGAGSNAVTPADLDESGIYVQLLLQKMPTGPDKLNDKEIKAIGDWILDGARDN